MKSFIVILFLWGFNLSLLHSQAVENHAGAWFYQNPLIQIIEPIADQGSVYPVFQNGLKTIFGGFLCTNTPEFNAQQIEHQLKKSKISFRKLTCKVPGAFQYLIQTSTQTHLLTISPQNMNTQIHLTTMIQDPAFEADFPSLHHTLPAFSNSRNLFEFERVLKTGQDMTSIIEFKSSREEALASFTSQLQADGWKLYLPPTEMAPKTAIMLLVKDQKSIFATQIQKGDQTFILCNVHPKILQPKQVLLP